MLSVLVSSSELVLVSDDELSVDVSVELSELVSPSELVSVSDVELVSSSELRSDVVYVLSEPSSSSSELGGVGRRACRDRRVTGPVLLWMIGAWSWSVEQKVLENKLSE